MRSFFPVFALIALAGQALALNITFGGAIDLTPIDLLTFAPGPYTQACNAQCIAAVTTISTCTTDNVCLCSDNTANSIAACEQCLFEFFIKTNTVPPEPKIGASTAVAAYAAACLAETNVTLSLALTLPKDWMGLQVLVLNTPTTVAVVGFGGILGLTLLYIMSNLS